MTFSPRRKPAAPDTAALGRSEQARGEAFTEPQHAQDRPKGAEAKIPVSSIMRIFRRKKDRAK